MTEPTIETLVFLATQGKLPSPKLLKSDLESKRPVSQGRGHEDPKTKNRNKIAKASRKRNRRK